MSLTYRKMKGLLSIISTAIALFWPTAGIAADCQEPFGPATADLSPNRPYFEKLLAQGPDAPLDSFMRLWYPDRKGVSTYDSLFEACLSSHSKCGGHIQIDTVYSWGPLAKIKSLESRMRDGGEWHGNPNPGHRLDTLASPLGSYGYGIVPVRIRLSPIPAWMEVVLRLDYDYVVGDEIESWSYGTPEHYDEIVRDYLRFKSGEPWIGYMPTADDHDNDRLFFESSLDGHAFNPDALKNSLREMIRMVLNGEGRIYYAKGQCRNRSLEFQTRFPTYFNPFLRGE
jgi:hypothetical protein